MSSEWKKSVCPYDCPDACGLLLKIEAGSVTAVKGDPDHPYTRGVLCPKMARYEKIIHSPERLKRPLLRVGAKGDGKFREASWAEAVEVIAQRWKQIIAKPINNVAPTRTCKGNHNKPSSGMIIGIKATAPAGAKNFPRNSNKENIQRKIGSTTTTSGKCKYLCPTI